MAAFRSNIELLAQAAKILIAGFDSDFYLAVGNMFAGTQYGVITHVCIVAGICYTGDANVRHDNGGLLGQIADGLAQPGQC